MQAYECIIVGSWYVKNEHRAIFPSRLIATLSALL